MTRIASLRLASLLSTVLILAACVSSKPIENKNASKTENQCEMKFTHTTLASELIRLNILINIQEDDKN